MDAVRRDLEAVNLYPLIKRAEREVVYLKLIRCMIERVNYHSKSLLDDLSDLPAYVRADSLKHHNKRLESSKEALAWLIKRYENL